MIHTLGRRYGAAAAASALALIPWKFALQQGVVSSILLCLGAVLVSSWYGGLGPGLVAALVGAVASLDFFLPSLYSMSVTRMFAGLQLLAFVFIALSISWISSSLRRSHGDTKKVKQQLRQQFDLTMALTRNLGEGVLAVDTTGRITFANPTAESMLDWSEIEVVGKNVHELIHRGGPEERRAAHHVCPLLEPLRTGATVRTEEDLFARRDRSCFPVDYVSSPIESEGTIVGAVLAFRDISERKAFEKQLRHQALHDALTDLPNRTLFQDRLQQAILSAARDRSHVALLLIDLDRFKEINDTFGHHLGDLLLQQMRPRLRSTLRQSDTIARLGGDEFAVLLPAADAAGATHAAGKVHAALEQAFELDGQSLEISASVGIALYPDHGDDANTLLRRADVAMYVAKRANSGYAIYAPEQDEHSPMRLALMGDLRQAIEGGQLVLYYQPKMDFSTGRIHSVEALVRWRHPRFGFLSPDQFIPLAEHSGLIKPLSIWVLNEALYQCRIWLEDGHEVRVGVNLSARTVHDGHLVDTIGELLRRWDVDARWLEVEITESDIMVDPVRSLDILSRMHDMGIRIAIDDFGTGYSSLTYLKKLPVDEIKIDKSFVLDMAGNEDDVVIARSVIDLGHNLGLQVVAEGAEDPETWSLLAAMGCDLVQGYYLSPPVAPDELGRWFHAWTPVEPRAAS